MEWYSTGSKKDMVPPYYRVERYGQEASILVAEQALGDYGPEI